MLLLKALPSELLVVDPPTLSARWSSVDQWSQWPRHLRPAHVRSLAKNATALGNSLASPCAPLVRDVRTAAGRVCYAPV